MANKEPSEKIVLYENDQQHKIKNIYYGYPKNPIEWPHLRNVDLPEQYVDITEFVYKLKEQNPIVNLLGGGYFSDHHRTHLFENDYDLKSLNSRPLYKEILIVREDGSEYHYSKWKNLFIHF